MSGEIETRGLTRRGLLSLAASAGALALAGCSRENDELAQQAGSDQGYVSGSGVITQVAPADRGAPLELDFETLDGETLSLAELRPTLVVINLWYAACPPCRKEAPDLISVSEEFSEDAVFIGANVRDQAGAAEAFISNFEVPYPNMLDTDGAMVALLSDILPPQATPSTVILDAEGRAAARVVGAVDASTLRGMIEDVRDE